VNDFFSLSVDVAHPSFSWVLAISIIFLGYELYTTLPLLAKVSGGCEVCSGDQ
jgi:hypothetical protein